MAEARTRARTRRESQGLGSPETGVDSTKRTTTNQEYKYTGQGSATGGMYHKYPIPLTTQWAPAESSLRDTTARGQLPPRDESSLDAPVTGVQDENTGNNAPSPAPEDMHHSVQFQSSSTNGDIPSPPSGHDPAGETFLNLEENSFGGRPGSSSAGLRNPLPSTRFGLKKGEQFESMQRPPTDYRRKYAEDPPYKELDSEARWTISSVLTTFVAQTSQALSTDNTAVSNSILLELIALQRAVANGTSLESIPSADTSFTAALSDVWVNGLWFTSLALSLATALLAVLAKQWLRQYSSFITGSAHERAMIHQFRYACFDKWGVQFIIGFLPVILHLSLGLFMAGLVVFLSALNRTITTVVGCIAGFLFGVYITTNALPILAIGCPYRTPLTPLLYSFIYGLGQELCHFCIQVVIFILAIPYILVRHVLQFAGLLSKTRTKLPSILFESYPRKSLLQAERSHVHLHEDQWTNSALSWLTSTTSDPSAKIILVEALGTLKTPLNVTSLHHVFDQQWGDISFLPNEPGTYSEEMLLGRLMRSTVTQSPQRHWVDMAIMLDQLPLRPIWVNDHSTILAIASCRRASTFHWVNNRPLVLPPHEAFGFVIDHYAVFDQVIVPMWMWLSICVQAVGIEQIPHSLKVMASNRNNVTPCGQQQHL
ncbi:hypothetical protein B0H14DRAFT_3683283 [Mycena olivaceomarginata]|nr:hypothetical protein B0H14DRAFT_3683283 [Mycena olivaceomarginata]